MNAATLLVAALLSLTGCSREPDYVAQLVVSPETIVLRAGQCTPMTLTWTPAAPLERREGNPTVFVHLLDGPHNLVRTFDHRLDIEWSVGKQVAYQVALCQSALAEPLAPGTYSLKVGLYDDVIGYRWPLLTKGVEAGPRGYRVARVVVPGSPSRIPAFELVGRWGNRETLDDTQTRARQPFTSGARIRVKGVSAPGMARLLVAFHDEGLTTVTTSCGGRWTSNQPGHHPIELPIEGDDCEITLDSQSASGAYLEGLGWKL